MMTANPVQIQGDLAVLVFNRFDLTNYEMFLRAKQLPESQIKYDPWHHTYTLTTPARLAGMLGAVVAQRCGLALGLAPHLHDYQAWGIDQALKAKRFAAWYDTGLGKMAMALEWARQVMHITGRRVLVHVPVLELIDQYLEETERFYGGRLPVEVLSTRKDLVGWCKGGGQALGIATYHKFIPGEIPDLRRLGGLIADESSILKTGGGTIKWNLVKSARGIEYKLSLTAVPAPNESMEYASQGSFLEKIRTEGDVIWTYFCRNGKNGNWKIRDHAKAHFYRFLASWSVYMRNPAAFGFKDVLAGLPDPEIVEEQVEMTDRQRDLMHSLLVRQNKGLLPDERLTVQMRQKFAEIARGFLYDKGKVAERIPSRKVERVAAWVSRQLAEGRPTMVWTVFDEEAPVLREILADDRVGVLSGKMKDAERRETLHAFKSGQLRGLISKPELMGFGLNLQFVKSMVLTVDDSFERRYQTIRRAVRQGQTDVVRVYQPYVPELEGVMYENVAAKERRFFEEVAIQEREYQLARTEMRL